MSSFRRTLSVIALSLVLAGPARAVSNAEIRAASKAWAKSVAGGDARVIAGHYAKGARLLGTFSKQARGSRGKIHEYFTGLTSGKQVSVKFAPGTWVQRLSDDVAVHSGDYTFRIREASGAREVPARFSITYLRQADGSHKIANHHSSVVPTDLRPSRPQ
jgi:uncharacterized protein (TIGR02246 family)